MSDMALVAKITSKGQTTIPLEIRKSLGIQSGDVLLWELDADGSAHVRPIHPANKQELQSLGSTLGEWHSPADEAAYRDL